VPKTTLRDDLHASILEELREVRVRQGLSMNEVAAWAGLDQSVISLIERSLRSPNLDTLLRIAEALEIDLWSLVQSATERARRKGK
jgi:transcriptional regulator with XRE-family HTH domain